MVKENEIRLTGSAERHNLECKFHFIFHKVKVHILAYWFAIVTITKYQKFKRQSPLKVTKSCISSLNTNISNTIFNMFFTRTLPATFVIPAQSIFLLCFIQLRFYATSEINFICSNNFTITYSINFIKTEDSKRIT